MARIAGVGEQSCSLWIHDELGVPQARVAPLREPNGPPSTRQRGSRVFLIRHRGRVPSRPVFPILAASVVAATLLAACQAQPDSTPDQASGPGEWSYAVVEAPIDPWSGDLAGRVTTFDGDGAATWSLEVTGLQATSAATDGRSIYLSEVGGEVVIAPDGVARVPRAASAEAEVASHAVVVDARGNGLALLNEGFAENDMGYLFHVTTFADGEVVGHGEIEGFVRAVWECEHANGRRRSRVGRGCAVDHEARAISKSRRYSWPGPEAGGWRNASCRVRGRAHRREVTVPAVWE